MEEAARTDKELLNSQAEQILAFGPLKLLPRQKAPFKSDCPHVMGNRALEFLTLLVSRAGKLIGKEELFMDAWPNMHVEEANLRMHIAARREAPCDGQDGNCYVMTLPRRGYYYVAPVACINGWAEQPLRVCVAPKTSRLPKRLTSPTEREQVVFLLMGQLESGRFITIVGPGGVGKTSVALTIAHRVSDRYEDGVYLVDLAQRTDAEMVPTASASVLGMSVTSDDLLPSLLAALKCERMLLFFDNWEQVIGTVASLAEVVLQTSDNIGVLATSREALRTEGEWTHRLAPLDMPEYDTVIKADRAVVNCSTFEICDDNAPVIVELCRRLDGIPPAIELAAARVELFGVKQLSAQPDARLLSFSEGRYTALPRHQNMQATLDWSYSLLSEGERKVLRAISIFNAVFGGECTISLLAIAGLCKSGIMASIESLSEKSLLRVAAGAGQPKCRLLETTKAYAFGKLCDRSELPTISRLHAERLAQLLTEAEANWIDMREAEWVARYEPMAGDLRSALCWSLSARGDTKLAIALTEAARPFWVRLSLAADCSEFVAISFMKADDFSLNDSEGIYRQMKFLNALWLSLIFKNGPKQQVEDALKMALSLAEYLSDIDDQLRLLWAIFIAAIKEGDYFEAVRQAGLFRSVGRKARNPQELDTGDLLLGFALHLLGQHNRARIYIEAALDNYAAPATRADIIGFQYDQRVAARVPLSSILWLQGYAEQAMDNAAYAVDEAKSADHAMPLGDALSAAACRTAFSIGDFGLAEKLVSMVADYSARCGVRPWGAWGRYFKGVLQSRGGQIYAGLDAMDAALKELRTTGFVLRRNFYLREYAELLGKAGRVEQGLMVAEEALSRCRRDSEGLFFVKFLRVKGNLLRCQSLPDAVETAEGLFQRSLHHSEAADTFAWMLRTAVSFAKLRIFQNRDPKGRRCRLRFTLVSTRELQRPTSLMRGRCWVKSIEQINSSAVKILQKMVRVYVLDFI
jgi:predicted ATPase/DNA-binding winged helix-turn-helix (wHTH) protein